MPPQEQGTPILVDMVARFLSNLCTAAKEILDWVRLA